MVESLKNKCKYTYFWNFLPCQNNPGNTSGYLPNRSDASLLEDHLHNTKHGCVLMHVYNIRGGGYEAKFLRSVLFRNF